MDFRSGSSSRFASREFPSSPWQRGMNISREASIDRSWGVSQSPLKRTSPASSFDRQTSSWSDWSFPLSTASRSSRDQFRRRFSFSGIHVPTGDSILGKNDIRFTPPSTPPYTQRSYSYAMPTEHLERRRRWYSLSRSPSYTSRNSFAMPASSSSYSSSSPYSFLNSGSAYARPLASFDRYDSGYRWNGALDKRSTYTSGYAPQYSLTSPRRDMSVPTYAGYYSTFARQHRTDAYAQQPRSTSMSTFSNQSLLDSTGDESYRSRLRKILNKHHRSDGDDDHDDDGDHKWHAGTSRGLSNFSRGEDRWSTTHDGPLSRYWSQTRDRPRKTARELYNEIKDTLEESGRDRVWLNRSRDEYVKHHKRLSSLLLLKHDELKLPDRIETTFTSVSGRSTPLRATTTAASATATTPIITISNGNDEESNREFVENAADPILDELLGENDGKDISTRELAKLLKTDSPEEMARMLLDRGESFRPDEISTEILPSGQRALVMTQTKQTAVADDRLSRRSPSPAAASAAAAAVAGASSPLASGLLSTDPGESKNQRSVSGEDQRWADEEIEKFTQLTGEFEESLQTLEHFITRNRSLFPENLIIYQKIVYHKSAAGGGDGGGEAKKQGAPSARRFSFAEEGNVCAVRVREKLVLPHGCRRNGCDVAEMLSRCYPRFEEVEVVYDDEENIKETLLRHENGRINPFDDDREGSTDDGSRPTKTHNNNNNSKYNYNNNDDDDQDSGKNSVADDDNDDEILRRCRRNDEDLPYFVTRPRMQTTLTGQSVRFTCSVSGNPEPSVTWYKNGLPLPRDGRFAVTNNFGICSLRISATRPDDRGAYTVEVENSVGAVRAEVDLDILSTEHQSKSFTSNLSFTKIPPYYVHMTEGDPLTLRCKLRGDRKPKVTWYKGSREISTDDKFRLSFDGDGWQFALQIRRLDVADASLYTVVADDGLTSLRHSVEVNVAPKRNLDDTITEYEIVKKMAPVKMAPVFVKELPLQYRLKEGSNLLIGCEVDESDPQPHLIGVEIVEKKVRRSESKDNNNNLSSRFQTEGRNHLDFEADGEPWIDGEAPMVPPVM